MIRNVLTSISGIGIFPTIALLIFFTLFVGAVIYVFRMDKPYEKHMSELPLKDNSLDERE